MTKETISFTPIEASEEYSRHIQINLRFQKQVTTPYTDSTIIYAQNEQGQRVVVKISAVNGALREWEGLNRTYNVGLLVPKPYALVKDNAGRTGGCQQKTQRYDYGCEESEHTLSSTLTKFGSIC